jgi:hypothetical protein
MVKAADGKAKLSGILERADDDLVSRGHKREMRNKKTQK